jgi:hypothetical protein
MAGKLFITNKRMLELWSYAKRQQLVGSDEDWCKRIGFSRPNLYNVKSGRQSFTVQHILKACQATGANVNWIFGLEENMFRNKETEAPIIQLKRAVIAVENQLKKAPK